MITEGTMSFKGYRTYYRIAGDLGSGRVPLLCLHGGPGSTHRYFESLDCLSEDRPIISYDQLGCGRSMVHGHPELWNAETWMDELEALRKELGLSRVHLLGQSWGGMLAISYACTRHPQGIQSMILSSTLSSAALWASEQHRLIRYLPTGEADAIAEAERSGDYTAPEYLAANAHYMRLHCCDQKKEDTNQEDSGSGRESYLTAWGPNEYTPTGTLRDYDFTDALHSCRIPALIISGTDDLCTPLVAKTMKDAIPDSQWELFAGSRHMCFQEQPAHYHELIIRWMNQHD